MVVGSGRNALVEVFWPSSLLRGVGGKLDWAEEGVVGVCILEIEG